MGGAAHEGWRSKRVEGGVCRIEQAILVKAHFIYSYLWRPSMVEGHLHLDHLSVWEGWIL